MIAGGTLISIVSWTFLLGGATVLMVLVVCCFTTLEIVWDGDAHLFTKRYGLVGFVVRSITKRADNVEIAQNRRRNMGHLDAEQVRLIQLWVMCNATRSRVLTSFESFFYAIERFPETE